MGGSMMDADRTIGPSGGNFEITMPEGWRGSERAPKPVVLMGVNPTPVNGFHASIVVTQTLLPAPGFHADDLVEQHIADVIAELERSLVDVTILDVWASMDDAAVVSQRFSFEHTVTGRRCSVLQDHHWVNNGAVVVTATADLDSSDELVAEILAALDSVIVSPT
jgi:hypothetical protein